MEEDELRHFENKEQMGMYMRDHQDMKWEDLKFWDKVKLINMFSPIAIAGNFF